MVLLIVGIALIAVGIALALYRRGDEAAGFQVFKINISGASWLIIVAMGFAAIVGWWWFDNEHVNTMKDPASDVEISVLDQAAFEESFVDEPYTFGDDGDLDQLWLSCETGAMQACDDLYQESPIESEYEFFGATCGLRFEAENAPEFCIEAPIDDTSSDLSTTDFEFSTDESSEP